MEKISQSLGWRYVAQDVCQIEHGCAGVGKTRIECFRIYALDMRADFGESKLKRWSKNGD